MSKRARWFLVDPEDKFWTDDEIEVFIEAGAFVPVTIDYKAAEPLVRSLLAELLPFHSRVGPDDFELTDEAKTWLRRIVVVAIGDTKQPKVEDGILKVPTTSEHELVVELDQIGKEGDDYARVIEEGSEHQMSDLRAPCIHGRYEVCGIDIKASDQPRGWMPCPGGRQVTIDYEAAEKITLKARAAIAAAAAIGNYD